MQVDPGVEHELPYAQALDVVPPVPPVLPLVHNPHAPLIQVQVMLPFTQYEPDVEQALPTRHPVVAPPVALPPLALVPPAPPPTLQLAQTPFWQVHSMLPFTQVESGVEQVDPSEQVQIGLPPFGDPPTGVPPCTPAPPLGVPPTDTPPCALPPLPRLTHRLEAQVSGALHVLLP